MTDKQVETLLEKRWEEIGFEKLHKIEKMYISIFWLSGDVMNGGFNQYFYNSTGDLAGFALEGCKVINATKTQSILEAAMKKLKVEPYPQNNKLRHKYLSKLADSTFDSEDSQFYDYPEEIDELSLNMLKQHYKNELKNT